MENLSRYRTQLGLLAAAARRSLSLPAFTALVDIQRELWQHERWHRLGSASLRQHYGEIRILLGGIDEPNLRGQTQRLLGLCRRLARARPDG